MPQYFPGFYDSRIGSESDLHSNEATKAVAKKAQKKILRLQCLWSFAILN